MQANRYFENDNGQEYVIVAGGKGKTSLLINLYSSQCVVCANLQETSWYQGNYFNDFDEAYKYFKKMGGVTCE